MCKTTKHVLRINLPASNVIIASHFFKLGPTTNTDTTNQLLLFAAL